MGRSYKGGKVKLAVAIEAGSAFHGDTRDVVDTYADLKSNDTWIINGVNTIPVGYRVFCKSDNCLYMLVAADFTSDASWKKFATADNIVGGTSFKGTVNNLTTLGTTVTNPSQGDMYWVEHADYSSAENLSSIAGAFYIYNGNAWDKINREEVSVATSAGKLTTKRTINGLEFDGTANVSNFFECSTGASTANKTVSLTDVATVDNVIPQGVQVRVKFTYANTAIAPTLNDVAIKRRGVAFNTWEAGSVITFTHLGTGTNERWEADEAMGIDKISSNFSAIDFASYDLNNSASVTDEIINDTGTPSDFGNSNSTIGIFQQKLIDLAEHPDGKLHFVKFKGKRCKFDINQYSNQGNGTYATGTVDTPTKTFVTFSFLYSSYGKKNNELVDSQIVRLITVTITWDGGTVNAFTFTYSVKDIGGGGGGDLQNLSGIQESIANLEQNVENLKSSNKWYILKS